MAHAVVNVSMPPDLLEAFDKARGIVPRSALLQALVREYLGKEAEHEG